MASRLWQWTALLPALCALSCGADEAGGEDSASRLVRANGAQAARSVALELDGTWPVASTATTVIDVPKDLAGWRIQRGPELRTVPLEAGGYGLELPQSRDWTLIDVPVDLTPGRFDRMHLHMDVFGFVRTAAQLTKDTAGRVLTPYGEALENGGPVVIEVDLTSLRRITTPREALTVAFPFVGQGATLRRIELFEASLASALPAPDRAPEHVRSGSASRPAYGLPPGAALRGPLPPLEGPGQLELAFAHPAFGPLQGRRRTTVQLVSGGRVLVARDVNVVPGRWNGLTLALEEPSAEATRRDGVEIVVSTDAAGGLLVATPLVMGPRPVASKIRTETVLLVTSDTHRGDFIGYAGDVQTPFLDGLAASGVRFDRATSVTSITNPSHASVMTGLHPRDTAILGNLTLLAERAETLAEAFQRRGYRTFAAVSVRHLIHSRSGLGQGFERFDGPVRGLTRDGAETIARAQEMLDGAQGQPVFLWLHLFEPHAPYLPHDELVELYYQGDPYDEKFAELPANAQVNWDKRIRDAAYIRALYKNEVSRIDQLLADFYASNARVRDGLLAFTSDHGESFGEDGQYWKHRALSPFTIRVPLLLAGAGLEGGTIASERVSNQHLGATLLSVAVNGPHSFPGAPLTSPRERRRLDAEPRFFTAADGVAAAIELDPWFLVLRLKKLIWSQPPSAPPHGVELYDLRRVDERYVNVAADHPDVVPELRAALVEWLSTAPRDGGLAGAAPDGGAAQDIEALGYSADGMSALEGALMDPNCGCAECAKFRR